MFPIPINSSNQVQDAPVVAEPPIVPPVSEEPATTNAGGVPESAEPPVTEAAPPQRPVIVVNNRPFRDYALEAVTAFEIASPALQIYRRAGQLVSMFNGDDGRRSIQTVGASELCLALSESADFCRSKGCAHTHVQPPTALINYLLARRDLNIPMLRGITEVPVLRADGSIVTTPGYDEATGLFYSPAPELEIPSLPEAAGICQALALIEEVLADFPFEDTASKANAIALFLTPLVRTLIDGCVPLAIVNGTNPGTGKGLLTSVASIISTGVEASVETAPQSDDEWRKKLTAALRLGRNFIVWDNLRGILQAAPLEAALTTTSWTDRILGTSDSVSIPQRATWVATGNNIRLGTDMARRCYQIRLVPKSARPWEATGFLHPELLAWVRENRGELLMALLTVARSWFLAGCPAPHVKALGSFEAWTRVVGGILEHAGVQGFLGNLEEMYTETDDESAQWEQFLRTLREHFGNKPFTTAQVLQVTTGTHKSASNALAAAMPPALLSSHDTLAWRLGNAFRARLKSRFGTEGLYLDRPENDIDPHTKAARWRVYSDADKKLKAVA
jgi:hypothetical protein